MTIEDHELKSTIQISEIIFITTTIIFLFLLNALIISLSFFLFFPWLLLPFLMIYKGKNDQKQIKKGNILFILILGAGIIIVFMQVLVPIDFGLMTGIYGMDQVKIRPIFVLQTLPYLINKIYHGNTWRERR
ncbi:MAG: hypothetical protein ACFFFH_05680 [Candidatus Thorarchaeota archaeon]